MARRMRIENIGNNFSLNLELRKLQGEFYNKLFFEGEFLDIHGDIPKEIEINLVQDYGMIRDDALFLMKKLNQKSYIWDSAYEIYISSCEMIRAHGENIPLIKLLNEF